jgi:hypothetical protein
VLGNDDIGDDMVQERQASPLGRRSPWRDWFAGLQLDGQGQARDLHYVFCRHLDGNSSRRKSLPPSAHKDYLQVTGQQLCKDPRTIVRTTGVLRLYEAREAQGGERWASSSMMVEYE